MRESGTGIGEAGMGEEGWSRREVLKLGTVAAVGLVLPAAGGETANRDAAAAVREMTLSGGEWKLQPFAMEAGEAQKAFAPELDESGWRTAAVPGEVQLELGLKGMDLYKPSHALTRANDQEWWYRKRFAVGKECKGKLMRLVFEGVDYFAAVWLNGKELGRHEGCFVPFSFDVSEELHYGEENVVAVKVTSPWLPQGRGFEEYLKGSWVTNDRDAPVMLPRAPYVLGPHWGGIPAFGNAVFPMGIFRDVKLVVSEWNVVEEVFVHTRELHADGSATLAIEGVARNYGKQAAEAQLRLTIAPENFQGEALRLPAQKMSLRAGENRFRAETVVKDARLWWTWDLGEQNLYKLTATLVAGDGRAESGTVFGIRTVARDADMGYRLNGKRFFTRGTWYPISDYYLSRPTQETYEKDVEQLRAAQMNHVVAFTVVEKPEFYEMCDRLGVMVVLEFPFGQFGPMRVLSPENPRQKIFIAEALGQLRQIVTALRNHPSIAQWAAFAEAHAKSGKWAVGDLDLSYYQPFSDMVEKMVRDLAPGTIYHPSLCDLGEQHFWLANAGMGTLGAYNGQFHANTHFVSEYGSLSLPSLETLRGALTPEERWQKKESGLPRWFNLPIDLRAYDYITEFEQDGWFSDLYRTDQFVDRHIASDAQLVEASQLYHAFMLKYATEAYRRKKHHEINGIRNWCYRDVSPQSAFGFVDYGSIPKIPFYSLRNAAAPFAINFAYEEALESQVSGKALRLPVWVVNDHLRPVKVTARCVIRNLRGETVAAREFAGILGANDSQSIGVLEWVAAAEPGIYVLTGTAKETGGTLAAANRTFIKVTPKLFARPVKVLLIGQKLYGNPIAEMIEGVGVEVDWINESSFERLGSVGEAAELRRKYDAIWLASFDSVWKLLSRESGAAIREAVRQGVGFIHTGGAASFHGGLGHGAYLELTPLGEILPVETGGGTDLIVAQPRRTSSEIEQIYSPIREIEVTAQGAEWGDFGLKEQGIPGFNEVTLKPGAEEILRVCGRPLLAMGRFGAGRTLAFTGFSIRDDAVHDAWAPSIVYPFKVDQQLYSNPFAKPYLLLAMRMLAEVTGEKPAVAYESLMAAREKPLFECLKDQPAAEIAVPAKLEGRLAGKKARLVLKVRAGERYARLVRVRAVWDGAQEEAPYLALYSDNYFDLLPGEEKMVEIEISIRPQGARKISGKLLVEGTNVARRETPIILT